MPVKFITALRKISSILFVTSVALIALQGCATSNQNTTNKTDKSSEANSNGFQTLQSRDWVKHRTNYEVTRKEFNGEKQRVITPTDDAGLVVVTRDEADKQLEQFGDLPRVRVVMANTLNLRNRHNVDLKLREFVEYWVPPNVEKIEISGEAIKAYLTKPFYGVRRDSKKLLDVSRLFIESIRSGSATLRVHLESKVQEVHFNVSEKPVSGVSPDAEYPSQRCTKVTKCKVMIFR